jgi:hypothetical protein
MYTLATGGLYNRWEMATHSGFTTVKRLTNNRQYHVICIFQMPLSLKLIYLLVPAKLPPAGIFDFHMLHVEVP